MKQQRACQKKLIELVKLIIKSVDKKEDSKFRNYQMQVYLSYIILFKVYCYTI
jgi:hypothetical protein